MRSPWLASLFATAVVALPAISSPNSSSSSCASSSHASSSHASSTPLVSSGIPAAGAPIPPDSSVTSVTSATSVTSVSSSANSAVSSPIPPSSPVSSFTSFTTSFSSATTASGDIPSSITSTASLGSSSSPSPASKSASTTTGSGSYSNAHQYANGNSATALCDGVNVIDAEKWDKFRVDASLQFLMDYYPTNSVTSEVYDDDINFPAYMANTQGYMAGDIGCEAKSQFCYNGLDQKSMCITDGKDSPIVFTIMTGIKNFWSWQKTVIEALYRAKSNMEARVGKMVDLFTDTDIGKQGLSNYLTIAAGSLILITPFFAPLAQAAVIGGSVLAAGIIGATQKNAAEVLSNEFKNIASVSEAVSNTTDVLVKSIESIASHLLETPPAGDDPSQDPYGAAQILKDGSFAVSYSTVNYEKAETYYEGGLAGVALNSLYAGQSVFIIITKANDRYKKMDMPVLGEDARGCDDDHCYFYVVDQPITKIGAGGWQRPVGLTKFGEFGMNLVDFGKGAAWYQKKYGGYSAEIKTDDLLQSFQSDDDKPPGDYWVNLPVVDYDDAPDISSWDVTSHVSTGFKTYDEDRVLSTVGKYLAKKDGWPYKHKLGAY